MIPAPLMTLVEAYAADGRVSPEEVAKLRASLFPDGVVSRGEAEALFVLNDRVDGGDDSWGQAFAEAISDHLIDGGEPRGHVSEDGASWLESRLKGDGKLTRPTEIEAVLKTLERAETAPAHLARLARDLVRRAILDEANLISADHDRVPGQIKAAEAALIRRVLHASAACGGVWVTREEADWLFELDEATVGYDHDPAWQDVFVKGVLNHLFNPAPSELVGREASRARSVWLAEKTPLDAARFWGRAFTGGPRAFGQRVRQPSATEAMETYYAERVEAGERAEAFDLAEATYISVRTRMDGRKSPNEQALMAAIKDEQARAA
jgi:hypothetical protein